jgi:uncharacterized YccA/Bax inhibitor family protein
MRPGPLRRLRIGELIALAGAILVIVALTRPWYETPTGNLSAWATFGPAVALLMISAIGALVLVLTTVFERSTALPVAAGVWSVFFAILGVLSAVVRVLERPDSAHALCAGAWLGLVGALLIAVGSWLAMRDERTGLYPPIDPEPRAPGI